MSLRRQLILLSLVLASATTASANVKDEGLEAGRRSYERSDYVTAVQILQAASTKDPQNSEVQLLLAKSYYELHQFDGAIASAEKAVAINPQNSVYHEWLGRAYGEKADHSGWLSGISLAKKTRKELGIAVQLDSKNFSARQALIEFDCAAPGLVGGGEDHARPHIAELAAMDPAEGHYAAGNCRRQKKDYAAADEEFTKALRSNPSSPELIYDIGDYALKRGQTERLLEVADAGEKAAPRDVRGKFYRGVALVLKKEKPEKAEMLLREYLKSAPVRTAYPKAADAHHWLGRLYENQDNKEAAASEYEAALKLDPKNKSIQESLKKLGKA